MTANPFAREIRSDSLRRRRCSRRYTLAALSCLVSFLLVSIESTREEIG